MRHVRRLLTGNTHAGNHCLRMGARFASWNQIPGDYLEFGCGSGRSLIEAYHAFRDARARVAPELQPEDLARFEAAKPRFFAFDSYQGLPEPRGIDAHPYRPLHWKKARYAFTVDAVKRTMRKRGVDLSDVHMIDGWFGETLSEATRRSHAITLAAMVHVDCDYYESSVLALDFIAPLAQDGTVIVFDDYNFFRGSPRLGERRAFAEWLERNPRITAVELARHDFSSTAFYLTLQETGA